MWRLEDFWTCWISTKSLTHIHRWREEEGAQNWIVNVETDYFSHLLLCGLQVRNFCRRNTVLLPSGRSHGPRTTWLRSDGSWTHKMVRMPMELQTLQRKPPLVESQLSGTYTLGRPASSVATSPEWKCWDYLGWVWKRGIGRHDCFTEFLPLNLLLGHQNTQKPSLVQPCLSISERCTLSRQFPISQLTEGEVFQLMQPARTGSQRALIPSARWKQIGHSSTGMGSNGILIKKNQGILKFHLGWDHHASQTRMLNNGNITIQNERSHPKC